MADKMKYIMSEGELIRCVAKILDRTIKIEFQPLSKSVAEFRSCIDPSFGFHSYHEILEPVFNELLSIVNEDGKQAEYAGDEHCALWSWLMKRYSCTMQQAVFIHYFERESI